MSNSKSVIKTVQKKEEFFIQFTDEEMFDLGLKPHDKFEIEAGGDHTIVLKKMVPLEIELGDFDKGVLVFLIEESIREQKSVDDVIRENLEKILAQMIEKDESHEQ